MTFAEQYNDPKITGVVRLPDPEIDAQSGEEMLRALRN
jgi:hypothetical protein